MTAANLAKVPSSQLAAPLSFTEEQSQMIRDTFANGASESEFAILMEVAKARNLNPLLKQIHFVSRWDSKKGRNVWSTQISIDGLRTVAARTGHYDGQDEPENEYDAKGRLVLVKVRVYRKGVGRPFVGIARWDEYVQTTKDGSPTRFWKDMPHTMLAKCAEALAIRKAFPEDASGLYVAEEMAQSENVIPVSHQLPRIDPHDDGGAQDQVDNDVYLNLLDRANELEAFCRSVDCYDKLQVLTRMVGRNVVVDGKSLWEHGPFTGDFQKARDGGLLSPTHIKELNKIFKRVTYEMNKPKGLIASYPPPDEDGGSLSEHLDPGDDFDRGAQ